ETGQLLWERLAECEGFGAFRDHHIAHAAPHMGQRAVLLALGVTVKAGNAEAWFCEVRTEHADLRSDGRLLRQPHVRPLSVLAAPEWPNLAGILAATFCDQAEAVDACLHGHDFA